MIVSVILDTEYMGMGERIKWVLKNLSHAVEDDYLVITHEYIKKHFDELAANCSERFYEEFEMRHITKEEFQKIDICYIPDSFFEEMETTLGTRTKVIMELFNNRNKKLEQYITYAVEKSLKRRKEKSVSYILNNLHCFKSISFLGEKYNCPVISYVFSAIRKVHGYRQTLYMANMSGGLFSSAEARRLYEEFAPEELEDMLLSKREIIALLGKERNLPLLSLMDHSGEKEIGIAREFYAVTPQCYCKNLATDDDIYYECSKYYTSGEIVSRVHPMQYDQMGIGRAHMENDPISFILRCKRIVTIQSQIAVKAMLWNRVVCTLSDALPFSFLLERNLKSERKVSEKDCNFLIFGYFIPSSCMFNKEYWEWRIRENPTINELYKRHLTEIFKNLGYGKMLLTDRENRLKKILLLRGCEKRIVADIQEPKDDFQISYAYLVSALCITFSDDQEKILYCLNRVIDSEIVSSFVYTSNQEICSIGFYPLDGVDGYVNILQIDGNGLSLDRQGFQYISKGKYFFKKKMQRECYELSITIRWIAQSFFEHIK